MASLHLARGIQFVFWEYNYKTFNFILYIYDFFFLHPILYKKTFKSGKQIISILHDIDLGQMCLLF